MAKIILNVELNQNASQQVAQFKKSLEVGNNSVTNTARLEKSYANLFNTIKNSKGAYPDNVFKDVSGNVNRHLQKIKEINQAYQASGKLTKEQKLIYSQLKKDLDKLSASFATTRAETEKLQKENKIAIPNVNNLRKSFANLLNTIQSTKKYYKKGTFDNIANEAKNFQQELLALDPTSTTYAEDVKRLDGNLNSLQARFAETKAQATNFHGSLRDIVGGFLKFQFAATIVMKPLQLIRNAWSSLNETLVKTEDAVISLQRVLNDDSLSDSTISGKLYDLAQRYGQTFDNVNDIAQNFARTGMSWNETIQATESALLALNVAELDATQASDGMIAVMQQFGYEASELTGIIDMLNKTADNYAVTTDKLLTALQRTGSSASNANLSLAETVGLITALSESTNRSGQNLGTAINSLIQYSSKDTALDTFASLDQNTADIVDKYRKGGATILDVWMAVSGVINNMDSRQEGILAGLGNSADITDLNQELQDELGDIFETVNDVYGTANTFRKNYFIALLGNMQTVQDAIETASDASGYSQKENEKYLDTYTAKVNTLNAKWQELVNNEQGFLGFKKGLVDLGILGLEGLELIGGLRTVTLALGTTIWSLFGPKLINNFKKLGASIKTMLLDLKNGALSLNSALGIVGVIATVVSVIDGAISSATKKEDNTAQNIQDTLNSFDELSNKLSSIETDAKKIKDELLAINSVLTDENSSVENINNANSDLYNIQQILIEQNKEFADSIDLTNLSYKEQLNLIDKLSEESRKKAVAKWIEDNRLGINTAQSYLGATFGTEIFKQDISNMYTPNTEFGAWLKNKGYNVGYYRDFGEDGILDGITDALGGLLGFNHDYTTIEHDKALTRTEKLELLNNLLKQALDEGKNDFAEIISSEIRYYNNDTYKNALSLIQGNANSNNWIERLTQEQRQQYVNGELSWEEIEEILGIVQETVDTTKTWEEQIKSVVLNYKDLLGYITEIRDREKEINDLEEKRQALEDAKNNKTVYQYNAATGNWERVVDEKAIKEAEEAYEEALLKSMEDEKLTVGQILEKVEGLPDLTATILEWLKGEGYNVPDNLMYGTSSTTPTINGSTTNNNSSATTNNITTINGMQIAAETVARMSISDLIWAILDGTETIN